MSVAQTSNLLFKPFLKASYRLFFMCTELTPSTFFKNIFFLFKRMLQTVGESIIADIAAAAADDAQQFRHRWQTELFFVLISWFFPITKSLSRSSPMIAPPIPRRSQQQMAKSWCLCIDYSFCPMSALTVTALCPIWRFDGFRAKRKF